MFSSELDESQEWPKIFQKPRRSADPRKPGMPALYYQLILGVNCFGNFNPDNLVMHLFPDFPFRTNTSVWEEIAQITEDSQNYNEDNIFNFDCPHTTKFWTEFC